MSRQSAASRRARPRLVIRWVVFIVVTIGAGGAVAYLQWFWGRPATPPRARPSSPSTIVATPTPAAEAWQRFYVSDPNIAAYRYSVLVPPGQQAVHREFGYDLEVVNSAGEISLLLSRYRHPSGTLEIQPGPYPLVAKQPFTAGPYLGQRFVFATPSDQFNPNAPVWWNNSRRVEIHTAVPSLEWVFVFTAPAAAPDGLVEKFAASFRPGNEQSPR